MEKNNENNIFPKIKYENFNKNDIIFFLNKISYIINNFFISINKVFSHLKNVSSILNKQIISSSYIIKDIKVEERYSVNIINYMIE